jgi:hypothetical protein
MELKEAVATFGIPSRIIVRMEHEGLISLPLDDAGITALSVLSRLWGRMWFVAEALKSIRGVRERTMLLLFPDHDKVDRYILNTFLGETNMRNLSSEVVRYRVNRAFGVDVDSGRIRRLRKIVVDIRRKKLKFQLGKLNPTYAEILGH